MTCNICKYTSGDEDFFVATDAWAVCHACVDEMPDCPACGNSMAILGPMGQVLHFTCRACGAQASKAFPLADKRYRGI